MHIEYRFFTFVASLYLSDKQKGIQSSHVLGDIVAQYMVHKNPEVIAVPGGESGTSVTRADMVGQWAGIDKTMIVKSANTSGEVGRIWAEIATITNDFPFAMFREDQESLGGAATAVGIVLPYCVWGLADAIRNSKIVPTAEQVDSGLVGFYGEFDGQIPDPKHLKLALLLNRYPLA